jgi:hypothetical protein
MKGLPMTQQNADRRSYANAALTVIALFLGVIAVDRVTASAPVAGAQQRAGQPSSEPTEGGMISAQEQRKQMIAELRGMSQRLDRIEGTLSKGISVKVTEMPELRLPKDFAAPKK